MFKSFQRTAKLQVSKFKRQSLTSDPRAAQLDREFEKKQEQCDCPACKLRRIIESGVEAGLIKPKMT